VSNGASLKEELEMILKVAIMALVYGFNPAFT
jgi:hypothetical protein